MTRGVNEIKEILLDNGLKATKERQKILEFLMFKKEPISVEDIYRAVGGDADQATVYRTLETFSKKGIVYKTDFREGRAFFEYQDNHHHHLVCANCGIKESVDFCLAEKIMKESLSRSKKFVKINSHILEFFGLCKKCDNICK